MKIKIFTVLLVLINLSVFARVDVKLENVRAVVAIPSADQTIAIRKNASELERYASLELQRYLYQVTGAKLKIREGGKGAFVLEQRADVPGPQGYSLKRQGAMVTIAGSDAEGVLYGVYGLLEDYYGVGFYFGGDVLPEGRQPLMPANLNETKKPLVKVRGILPWTNFPQSPSSYSWTDWKFIIDQMAKMRMNLLNIHNYNCQGHNEMFHNWKFDGWMARGWMPGAKSGHAWDGPGWDVNQYRFGAADLFDDFDFVADCSMHNESLTNEQVFRKGISEFQKVIAYAHSRGVKVALGIENNLVQESKISYVDFPANLNMDEYRASNPKIIDARVEQIASDYPDLDYLICYQSETITRNPFKLKEWLEIFNRFYKGIKEKSPHTRLAVSGWGIQQSTIAQCPSDVICAPIAPYTASFADGAEYGDREYWGCPWLERDGGSSQYYYPYNVDLSDAMKSWEKRAPNITGLHCNIWRLTDALDPKISWISKAAWDVSGKLSNSESVYRDYAVRNYGALAAEAITGIINQNEPFASSFAECQGTPPFSAKLYIDQSKYKRKYTGGDTNELTKANQQIEVIDHCIAGASPAQQERLKTLRCRIAAARDHILMNLQWDNCKFGDFPTTMQSWVRNFTHRVTDISSLGNVVSMQNRFVQLNYLPKEPLMQAPKPVESSLFPVVISPPASTRSGQPASVTIRVLDAQNYSAVTAILHWREAGSSKWMDVPMSRRVKAIFTGKVPDKGLVEYYLTVAEYNRTARFPSVGNLTLITVGNTATQLESPKNFRIENKTLTWDEVPGAFWYRIYRDNQLLTYVAVGTHTFKDTDPGFDGQPLTGSHNYQISAVDKFDHESITTKNVQ